MDSDNFCLNWNDFVKNVTSTFVELRRDKEFLLMRLSFSNDMRDFIDNEVYELINKHGSKRKKKYASN